MTQGSLRIAWELNLDADLELADPLGDRASTRRRAQIATQGERFLAAARETAPSGLVHLPLEAAGDGDLFQAWCPTPRALAKAGPERIQTPSPPLAVLQHANHRRFANGIGAGLPGARFVLSMAELEATLAAADPPLGWLLKRPFGFSGRGRKHLTGALEGADRTWATASMSAYGGGLQVEPFVHIEAEFALHGWIDGEPEALRGRPTRLRCDRNGGYLGCAAAGEDLRREEASQLHAAFDQVVAALDAAGYHGPFAIDGFRWTDSRGTHFRPVSEVNARYTMGYFLGLAGQQRAWARRLRPPAG